MRVILFFTILMTMMTAAFLFRVKHEVIGIERRVVQLTSNISSVQREMNTLRNELAHLIQPARMVAVVGESRVVLFSSKPGLSKSGGSPHIGERADPAGIQNAVFAF